MHNIRYCDDIFKVYFSRFSSFFISPPFAILNPTCTRPVSFPLSSPNCMYVCMYVHRAIRAQPVGAAVTCYPVDPRGQAQGKYHYLWSHLTSPDPKLKMCICCFFNCLILPIDPGARCGESLLALEGRESSKLTFLFH